MLTEYEQLRLAKIRASLEKQRAKGVDVSAWETEFFVKVIDRLVEQPKTSEPWALRS